MPLTLSALSLNDQPLSQPVVARFDPQGGTIGRGDQNTLALPDPERHISRQHARISAEGKGWRITNLSSANAVTVAGRTLGQGESATIRHRDLVRIGSFLLEARDDSADDDATTRTITHGRPAAAVPVAAAPPMPGPVMPAPVMPARLTPALGPPPLASPPPGDDPFADFFGPAVVRPASTSVPAATPDRVDPFLSAPSAPAARDPFDFGVPPVRAAAGPSAATSAAGTGTLPDDPFAGLMGGAPGALLDDLLGGRATGSATAAALDDFLRQPLASAPIPAMALAPTATPSLSPMPMPMPMPASPAPSIASLPDHVPAIQAAFEPPRAPLPRPLPVAAPPPAVSSLSPVSAAAVAFEPDTPSAGPGPAGDDRALLWQAFCAGAELKLPLPQGLTPELMQVIGQILRSAVDGTVQMMAIRAATKQELRADVTMIQARHNNPLKFSPDAQAALEQLLQPPVRGFLPGPEAMTDAMHDLVGHTIGTMAGMRAALEGVLNRFAPTVLEGKLSGHSMLDAVLPMNRRARLWELYLQHFEAIRGEAQEDFHTLFGRAFLAAYEQQLDRLHQGQRPPGPDQRDRPPRQAPAPVRPSSHPGA